MRIALVIAIALNSFTVAAQASPFCAEVFSVQPDQSILAMHAFPHVQSSIIAQGVREVLHIDSNNVAWHTTIDINTGSTIRRSRLPRPANHPGTELFVQNGVGTFVSENAFVKYDFNQRQVLSIHPIQAPRGTTVRTVVHAGNSYYAIANYSSYKSFQVIQHRVSDISFEASIARIRDADLILPYETISRRGHLVVGTSGNAYAINLQSNQVTPIPIKGIVTMRVEETTGAVDLKLVRHEYDPATGAYRGRIDSSRSMTAAEFDREFLGL